MIYIILGLAGYLCYIFFDLNTVHFQKRWGRHLFAAGTAILAAATICLNVSAYRRGAWHRLSPVFALLALVMFGLLIYTLFFALPSEEAYSGEKSDEHKVCDTGVYALCRHPGVIWLAGMYVALALMLPTKLMWSGAVAFSLADFIYVVLQDVYIFPKQFRGYNEYKKTTPFMVPNRESVRRMFSK